MADDGYSATQLRQRYNKGGSLKDEDLSAAQLRARHNVKGRGAPSCCTQTHAQPCSSKRPRHHTSLRAVAFHV